MYFYPSVEAKMPTFTAAEIQRKSSEIQRAATREPVFLTYHEKPRFVMLSIEDFVRLGGVSVVARPENLPDSVASRLQALADAHEDVELELAGGLAEQLE
jgi:hypothetical protein